MKFWGKSNFETFMYQAIERNDTDKMVFYFLCIHSNRNTNRVTSKERTVQQTIAHALGKSKQTISDSIKRLKKSGMIIRLDEHSYEINTAYIQQHKFAKKPMNINWKDETLKKYEDIMSKSKENIIATKTKRQSVPKLLEEMNKKMDKLLMEIDTLRKDVQVKDAIIKNQRHHLRLLRGGKKDDDKD